MKDQGKCNETSLLEEEDFWSHLNMEDITNADYHLNMEDITNADYTHTKTVYKHFEINIWKDIMICTFKAIHYY